MKKNIFIAVLALFSINAISQESMATLSGGYSFATIEDTDIKGTGWRINGSYEFNPMGGIFAHGISFGYIGLSASDGIGQQTIDISVNSFPVYYAPKVMLGNEKIKGFIKGAIGMQFAGLRREGFVEFSDFDFGFYGGGGAGVMLFIKDNIFVSAEYEIAYASNNWYKDGWMNSAMAGIGFKF